ncbi:MAG: hypothetical protein J6866_05025 [Victivallales bacterium]|nr:hypothetical protein [Victivallales bacterium]
MITSKIDLFHGAPALFIDGELMTPLAYITYLDERASYAAFRAAGYRIFSMTVYFGDRPTNNFVSSGPFWPGIFRVKGEADFRDFDDRVNRLLAEAPDALIFPRVNTSLPGWWEEENPEECTFPGPHNYRPRACFASDAYRAEAKRLMGIFLEHLQNTSYSDHFFGIQVAGGQTEEFLSFDDFGNDGPRAREKFQREFPQGTETEYRHFLSRMTAEAILELAHFTKQTIGRNHVIGSFYGYLFETMSWTSGHHALRMLLNSPDIDFLCSPISYGNRKNPGKSWYSMVPLASIAAHGKLSFGEYDVRTHRTVLLPDVRPEACPQKERYLGGVWLGPATERESIWHLQMNFLRQIANAHASWWFDMWGKWFDTPAIMRSMAEFHRLADMFLHEEDRSSVAQCAAWIDEDAMVNASCDEDLTCSGHARGAIEQSGVPFDFYEIGDFPQQAGKYRAMLFIVPADSEALRQAHEYCRHHGIPFLDVIGSHQVTPSAIRDLADLSDAFCYCRDQDVAVYAGKNLIGICAPETGTYTLQIPEARRWIPLFVQHHEEFTGTKTVLSLEQSEVAAFFLQ